MTWTPQDAEQLRALYQKALRHGLEPVEALGGFPHVDDFEVVGAMSDATKRQLDAQFPISSKANRKQGSSSEGVDSKISDGGYAVKSLEPPFPTTDPALTAVGSPELPPGVINTAQWGKTQINFGKFKSRNWSYMDLLQSNEEDAKSYVKWCRARTNSAGGELKDLRLFLYRFELEASHGKLRTGELIPGSGSRRVFK